MILKKTSHKLDSYLYKSWNNTCPDYTKSSVEDLDCCEDLAEEHHIRHGVKCVVERIWNEKGVRNYVSRWVFVKNGQKSKGMKYIFSPLPKMTSRTVMLTKIQEKPRNWTRLYTNKKTVFWLTNPEKKWIINPTDTKRQLLTLTWHASTSRQFRTNNAFFFSREEITSNMRLLWKHCSYQFQCEISLF